MRLAAAGRTIGSTFLVGFGASILAAVAYFMIAAQHTSLGIHRWDDYVVILSLIALILFPMGWLSALLMRLFSSRPIAKTVGSRIAFGIVCITL